MLAVMACVGDTNAPRSIDSALGGGGNGISSSSYSSFSHSASWTPFRLVSNSALIGSTAGAAGAGCGATGGVTGVADVTPLTESRWTCA